MPDHKIYDRKEIASLIVRLKMHNDWRRGGDGPAPDPYILGLDIDCAIELLEYFYELNNNNDH
jgi:hypothetical protein